MLRYCKNISFTMIKPTTGIMNFGKVCLQLGNMQFFMNQCLKWPHTTHHADMSKCVEKNTIATFLIFLIAFNVFQNSHNFKSE